MACIRQRLEHVPRTARQLLGGPSRPRPGPSARRASLVKTMNGHRAGKAAGTVTPELAIEPSTVIPRSRLETRPTPGDGGGERPVLRRTVTQIAARCPGI